MHQGQSLHDDRQDTWGTPMIMNLPMTTSREIEPSHFVLTRGSSLIWREMLVKKQQLLHSHTQYCPETESRKNRIFLHLLSFD